jgi:hypothetical protein
MNFKTLRVCLDPKLLSFSCAKCFLYVDVSESAPVAVESLSALVCSEFRFRSLYLESGFQAEDVTVCFHLLDLTGSLEAWRI